MSIVEIRDEENLAVLSDEFVHSMRKLDRGTEQKYVLKEIRKVIESNTPCRYIYEIPEGCDVLEILRGTDPLRIYCKLAEGVPQRNKTYNLLFLFYVDDHKYRERKLAEMDTAAKRQIEQIEAYRSLEAVDEYLDQRQALDGDDLTELIERGNDAFR